MSLRYRTRVRYHVVKDEKSVVDAIESGVGDAKGRVAHYTALPSLSVVRWLYESIGSAVKDLQNGMYLKLADWMVRDFLVFRRLGKCAGFCETWLEPPRWDEFVECVDNAARRLLHTKNDRYRKEVIEPAVEEAKAYWNWMKKELPRVITIEVLPPARVGVHVSAKYDRLYFDFPKSRYLGYTCAYLIGTRVFEYLRAKMRVLAKFQTAPFDVVRASFSVIERGGYGEVSFDLFPASFVSPEVVDGVFDSLRGVARDYLRRY